MRKIFWFQSQICTLLLLRQGLKPTILLFRLVSIATPGLHYHTGLEQIFLKGFGNNKPSCNLPWRGVNSEQGHWALLIKVQL